MHRFPIYKTLLCCESPTYNWLWNLWFFRQNSSTIVFWQNAFNYRFFLQEKILFIKFLLSILAQVSWSSRSRLLRIIGDWVQIMVQIRPFHDEEGPSIFANCALTIQHFFCETVPHFGIIFEGEDLFSFQLPAFELCRFFMPNQQEFVDSNRPEYLNDLGEKKTPKIWTTLPLEPKIEQWADYTSFPQEVVLGEVFHRLRRLTVGLFFFFLLKTLNFSTRILITYRITTLWCVKPTAGFFFSLWQNCKIFAKIRRKNKSRKLRKNPKNVLQKIIAFDQKINFSSPNPFQISHYDFIF